HQQPQGARRLRPGRGPAARAAARADALGPRRSGRGDDRRQPPRRPHPLLPAARAPTEEDVMSRTYLVPLAGLLACCGPLRAADYEQKQDGAVLCILRAAKVEDGQVETALGNVKLDLTLTIEGRAPLKVGAGDEQAVKAQVAALDSAPPGLGCKAV